MDDIISRSEVLTFIEDMEKRVNSKDLITDTVMATTKCVKYFLTHMPSAMSELTDEDWRLIKQLRSYHNGSYAQVLDKLIASSKQTGRDKPIKPNKTIDHAWGIKSVQAVCPKCDCYLGAVYFLADSDKKKITYCETCGQAIDWSEWEWDAERLENEPV